MNIDLKYFMNFLFTERTKQGLNQSELSRRSGVDRTMISRYENFKDLKVSTMIKLLKGLGYSNMVCLFKRGKEHTWNWTEKYFTLIKQVLPENMKHCDDVDEFIHILAINYLSIYAGDVTLVPHNATCYETHGTIAYCEEAYEQGCSAIINDGKLIGFRREDD